MKKLLLFLLLCTPFLTSCSDSNDGGDPSNEKTISYKFNTNTQLTGTNNLIGVQIYRGVKQGDLVNYSPFAYGLFDRLNVIKIDLPKDAIYKIVSTVIVDGKEKVKQDGSGYLKPFSVQGKGVSLNNSFTLNSNQAMTLLNESTTTLVETRSSSTRATKASNDEYVIPNLDRYYGEVVDYSGDSLENPEIDMKRTVFGVRLSLEDVSGIEEGVDASFFIYVYGAPDTLMVTNKEGGDRDVEKVYTLMDNSKQTSFRTKWWMTVEDQTFVGTDSPSFDVYQSSQMYVKVNPVIGNGMKWWNEKIVSLYDYYAPYDQGGN